MDIAKIAESFLIIDFGSLNTRGYLFDIVEGQYRLLAATIQKNAVSDGKNKLELRQTLRHLEQISGKVLIGPDEHIISPCQPDGRGVDEVSITLSDGKEISILILGILNSISLESAENLAHTTYGRISETIGINDTRLVEERLDAAIQSQPEIILISGGTDGGASKSMVQLLKFVFSVIENLPEHHIPEILYAGNNQLKTQANAILGSVAHLSVAPNIRPQSDEENLTPAQARLAQISSQLLLANKHGEDNLPQNKPASTTTTAFAFSRTINYMSATAGYGEYTLGVDLGSQSVSLSTAVNGCGCLDVFSGTGMGSGIVNAIQMSKPEDIGKWLPVFVAEETIRSYVGQKILNPGSVPITEENQAIEFAIARQLIAASLHQALKRHPALSHRFDSVLATGSFLSKSAQGGKLLLLLLDALQPEGVTEILIDDIGLASALGAVSSTSPALTVQVLDQNPFQRLATVISPISQARKGLVILSLNMQYMDGNTIRLDIRQGTIATLPLLPGQQAKIELNPHHNTTIFPRHSAPDKNGFVVNGGICGLVIDARGRPLLLPTEGAKRREQLNQWMRMLE